MNTEFERKRKERELKLKEKALTGNWGARNTLIDFYGYVDDYIPGLDDGEPPTAYEL